MTEPYWTQALTALLTPTILVFGSIIAYRQWRIAQNKLKLDLFEKRFQVYDVARGFLSSIMTSGKVNDEDLNKFLPGTREAKWLLNNDIATYFFEQIWTNAVKLQTLDTLLKDIRVVDERKKNVQQQGEIKKLLMAQFEVLDEKFGPFLKLGH